LSEDWRLSTDQSDAGESPASVNADLPEGWSWSCPEEIKAGDRHALAIGPFGSSLKVSDYKSEGVPLVFVREIRSRNFSSGSTKFVSVHKAQELKAHSIQGGDLLITKMGDPPGDVAIYPEGAPLAIITADCVRLRVDNTIAVAAFVGYTIVCTDTRERLRDITAGVAQRKISLSRFRHFALPLAPLKEQAEIIRRVEALFALADRIEARCTTARTQAQRLTPLVLAKAFRGELVPQDPNDEPANALLARIASSNSAVPGKNKREMPAALKNRAQEAINL
jgi:type I restriction enzyme S subunit